MITMMIRNYNGTDNNYSNSNKDTKDFNNNSNANDNDNDTAINENHCSNDNHCFAKLVRDDNIQVNRENEKNK